MFNSNNRQREAGPPPMPQPSAPAGKRTAGGMFSVLGPDVVVTGNIVAQADLHIDGRVEGDVTCGALTQGTESSVNGSITAESARVAGTIEGTVRARQLVVERTARISGDVEYESITIESGGQIDGGLRRVTSLNAPAARAATTLLPRPSDAEAIEDAEYTG